MKAVSFNVNGIRARMHQIERLMMLHDPDVIGLQETKVADELFPTAGFQALGYHVEYHGQKGHYGVALVSKQPPIQIYKGFPDDGTDAQKRFIYAQYLDDAGKPFWVLNGYFPQGESRDHPIKFPAKAKFYGNLLSLLSQKFTSQDSLLLMGDMNVAHRELDIGIGEENVKRWLRSGKSSFLPEEREWLQRILDWGFFDGYRRLNPNINREGLSWFDYRSRGFEDNPKRGLRIDYVFSTLPMLERQKGATICYEIRAMDKPSDHAPVVSEFS